MWSPDGRELFYRSGDETLAVDVETEPTFKRGNPKVLFRGKYLTDAILKIALTHWDVDPSGKKFLMIKPSVVPAATADKPTTAPPRAKINVVVNWFEELKQRVPTK